MSSRITFVENNIKVPLNILTSPGFVNISDTYDRWLETRDPDEFVDSIRNEGVDKKIKIEIHPYGVIKIVDGVDQVMVARMINKSSILADVEYYDSSERLHKISEDVSLQKRVK